MKEYPVTGVLFPQLKRVKVTPVDKNVNLDDVIKYKQDDIIISPHHEQELRELKKYFRV